MTFVLTRWLDSNDSYFKVWLYWCIDTKNSKVCNETYGWLFTVIILMYFELVFEKVWIVGVKKSGYLLTSFDDLFLIYFSLCLLFC